VRSTCRPANAGTRNPERKFPGAPAARDPIQTTRII
jgi:hypothetical protein